MTDKPIKKDPRWFTIFAKIDDVANKSVMMELKNFIENDMVDILRSDKLNQIGI